ncbi:HET-domain-containing protein [Stipitochalara longipes BDJ]|nr:HET-domain-containing protein [Stipitochalara longipes BDJ]
MAGRYIFENEETEDSSWTHPDPSFPQVIYSDPTNSVCNVEFEALSYVWGDPNPAQTAFVVPAEGEGRRPPTTPATVNMGNNLARALQYLRSPISPRRIWIDAICIDQNNVVERNEQVLRMRDIYKSARRVIVWLGEESPNSQLALNAIRLFSQQVEIIPFGGVMRSPDAQYRDWFHMETALPFSIDQWISIDQLLHRPWFERVWTMQEIAVGSPESLIQCGHEYLEWDSFRKAVSCLWPKENSPNIDRTRLYMISLATMMGSKTSNIKDILRSASNRKSTDPRDKIYGVLGLLPARFASRIKPNYSLPLAEVNRNFALAYFDHFQRLDILASRAEATQSWNADWGSIEGGSIGDRKAHFLASGISSSHFNLVSHSMLEVSGIIKAKIRTVGQQIPLNTTRALQVIRDSPIWAHNKARTYIDGTSFADALTVTLFLDLLKETFLDKAMGSPTMEMARRCFLSWQRDDSGILEDDIHFLTQQAVASLAGCCLFETEEGYIGVCMSWTKPGDIISVLLGCPTPLILRLASSRPGSFHIVGDCYVQGLMYAEAFLGQIPDPWRPVIGGSREGSMTVLFENTHTREISKLDTRLDPVSEEWEELPDDDRTADGPLFTLRFRNTVTGTEINSDPRMLPSALQSRGVKLTKILLE